MKITFKVEAVAVFDAPENPKGERQLCDLLSCELTLSSTKNVDATVYYDRSGRLNKHGIEIITSCLTEGLLTNLHRAHELKHWDSAEHLRYIINELERGFIRTTKTITYEE